jgi:hypothetical protein
VCEHRYAHTHTHARTQEYDIQPLQLSAFGGHRRASTQVACRSLFAEISPKLKGFKDRHKEDIALRHILIWLLRHRGTRVLLNHLGRMQAPTHHTRPRTNIGHLTPETQSSPLRYFPGHICACTYTHTHTQTHTHTHTTVLNVDASWAVVF